jgi:hypothetical protein
MAASRLPPDDCQGTITVIFSSKRSIIEVVYGHSLIHQKVIAQTAMKQKASQNSASGSPLQMPPPSSEKTPVETSDILLNGDDEYSDGHAPEGSYLSPYATLQLANPAPSDLTATYQNGQQTAYGYSGSLTQSKQTQTPLTADSDVSFATQTQPAPTRSDHQPSGTHAARPAKTARITNTNGDASKAKTLRTRSKTGCLTCRKRRVKVSISVMSFSIPRMFFLTLKPNNHTNTPSSPLLV